LGLNLGLEFCCLIQSCKSIEKFLGFQYKDENYYSNRLAFSNIKSINKKIILDFHYGKLYDDNFLEKSKNIDLTIITEKNDFDYIKNCLDFCWNNMKLDAYLVIDNLYCKQIQEIFYDFCKVNNVEASVFNTRYQTGIVRK
jgi:ubiquinone biosynthesis protein COQ9